MKRTLWTVLSIFSGGVLVLAGAGAGWGLHGVFGGNATTAPARHRGEAEHTILRELAALKESGQAYFSVPESDGRILRMLVESIGAKQVVEIGTSTGYSGLWLCLGMRDLEEAGALITVGVE